MSASDSRAFPQSPAVYRARVTFFSFPITWALLGDYPERKSPDRSELEKVLAKDPVVLIPAGGPSPLSGADQWEMVIPKMVRPPHRAHRLNAAKETV
jgi:hypothetical protein